MADSADTSELTSSEFKLGIDSETASCNCQTKNGGQGEPLD